MPKILPARKDRSFVGRSFLFLEEVDSTNSFCISSPELLSRPGLVVWAGRQTKGRGSKGREWHGGHGRHLFASFVIHPRCMDCDPAMQLPRPLSRLTILCGLAVFDALHGLGVAGLSLKWPNDVLIEGRKVAGILCELCGHGPDNTVVAGIGVNVSGGTEQFPAQLRAALTTLELAGVSVETGEVLELLCDALDHRLVAAARHGYGRAFEEWNEKSGAVGRRAWFVSGGLEGQGEVAGLDQEGRLVISLAGGGEVRLEWGTLRYI